MSSSFGNAQGMQSAVVTLQQGCRPEMVKDQSQCQLKLSGMGGDMGMQPIAIGINHKAANLAII